MAAELTISERNARASACGRYVRWLYRRYQKLDLVEMADVTEPIELRQIFVPMRVGREDLRDEAVGGEAQDVRKEELPGDDAWDLLAREPLVALSGRPGSGKTTLVQAVIAELCGEAPSRLRNATGAVPVPFILRSFPELERARNLNDLFDSWWPLQAEQAEHDRLPLDVPRLREILEPADPEALKDLPVLLLFDGIDEIGGRDVRQRLLEIAFEARARGYRVLVTGRPTGYQDLCKPGSDQVPLSLHYLLPFAWPQIEQFIHAWYRLRDEWERRKQTGIERFLGHLADRQRPHLRSLARRPIFLTLMALVHCTQNQMPEGRPVLYRQILDLYLERQERHRQRERTVEGEPMPHWPAAETRLVLAHIAWQSQIRGGRESGPRGRHDPESRRVVWAQKELEEVIRKQLRRGPGRFAALAPEDASALVRYFLHPAGLLVEPAEGMVQFAHLSFQEYLCAWFLHQRANVEGLRPYLERELFGRLAEPGWDEVGLLLLCIHAESTGQEGHFDALRWLDLAQHSQAALLISALTGRELPFTDQERREWLPLAVACCLIHPDARLAEALARVPEWGDEGLSLVLRLLDLREAGDVWRLLERSFPEVRPGRTEQEVVDRITHNMAARWLKPPDDPTWAVSFDPVDAQARALLGLINGTGWGKREDPLQPISQPVLEARLAAWLEARVQEPVGEFLWKRREELPVPTETCLELDALLPNHGSLWRLVTSQSSPDALLLQGEGGVLDEWVPWDVLSQAWTFLVLYPGEIVGSRSRLALCLFQAQTLVESTAEGRAFDEWSLSLSLSRSLSRSLSLSRSRSLSLSRSRSRSLSLSRSQSLSLSRSRSRSLSLSRLRSLSLSAPTNRALDQLLDALDQPDAEKYSDAPFATLSRFAERQAAFDWFAEQAEDPRLMQLRGLRPTEPLPRELELLDGSGRLLLVQHRENWVKLRRWLDDDRAILDFVFPEGLDPEARKLLRSDLELLRKQSWSPQSAIDALLTDWPEDQPERDISLEAADRALGIACENALAELAKRSTRKAKKEKPNA